MDSVLMLGAEVITRSSFCKNKVPRRRMTIGGVGVMPIRDRVTVGSGHAPHVSWVCVTSGCILMALMWKSRRRMDSNPE